MQRPALLTLIGVIGYVGSQGALSASAYRGGETRVAAVQRSRLASRGRPPRPAKALGRSIPSRSPDPAAAISAQVAPTSPEPAKPYALAVAAFGLARAFGFGCPAFDRTSSSQRAASSSSILLRVHELGREDLLRLHKHLLLAGREALLVVAQRRGSSRPPRARRCSRSSILSRLCLKRRFQFFPISVEPPEPGPGTTMATVRWVDDLFAIRPVPRSHRERSRSCRCGGSGWSGTPGVSPEIPRFSFRTTVPAPWCG